MSQPYKVSATQGPPQGTVMATDQPKDRLPEFGSSLAELSSRFYPVTLPHYRIRMGELFFGNFPISYLSPAESHLLLHASGKIQLGKIVDATAVAALPPFVRDALIATSQPIADIAEIVRSRKQKKRVVVLSGESGAAEQLMGAWIASNKDEYSIDIVTAFSAMHTSTHAGFPTGTDLGKIRIQESALAARVLGAAPLFLEFALSDVDRDSMCLERLALNLMRYCRSTAPELLFVPIGSSLASRYVLDVILGLHTAGAIPLRQLILYEDFGAINSVHSSSSCLARLKHSPFQLEVIEFRPTTQYESVQTCLNVFRTHDRSMSLPSRVRLWAVTDNALQFKRGNQQ